MRKQLFIGIAMILLLAAAANALSISGVTSLAIDHDTIQINYTTDLASDTKILYGTSNNLGLVALDTDLTNQHSITINELQQNTGYYFAIESSTGIESGYSDNSGAFYTVSTRPVLQLKNIEVKDLGLNSATITWKTDIETSSLVMFGTTSESLNESKAGLKTKDHVVVLSDLEKGRVYYYKIISDYAESDVLSFNTKSDTTAPVLENITVPEYHNSKVIDIAGTTKPGSTVFLSVEGVLKRQGFADLDGNFRLSRIDLPKDENKIQIKVVDPSKNEFAKDYTIKIDSVPPNVNMPELPANSTTLSYTLSGTANEPVSVIITVNGLTKELPLDTKFSEILRFTEGNNNVNVIVKDRAGNEVTFQKTIYADTKPPKVDIQPSISQYSPSVTNVIKLKGNVSEQSTLTIIVNQGTSKEEKHILTVDGPWEKSIKLERVVQSVGTDTGRTETSVRLEQQYTNTIKIYAVDRAGHKSTEVTGSILYLMCSTGQGNWAINVGTTSPDALSPIDISTGTAVFGLEFDLVWRGPGDAAKAKVTGKPTISKYLQLGSEFQKDIDLISQITTDYDLRRNKGFATFQLKKKEITKEQQLDSLSFPLLVEFNYEYPSLTEPNKMERGVQKECITSSILIDKTFDEAKIPKKFLDKSINFLNETVALMDKLIKPLKTVEKFVFIGCKVMHLRTIFVKADELRACNLKSFPQGIPTYTSGSTVTAVKNSKECDNYFSNDPTKLSDCQRCLDAKEESVKATHAMSLICDRYVCPSVPTAQYYQTTAKRTPASSRTVYYVPDDGFYLRSTCESVDMAKLEKDFKENKKDLSNEQVQKCLKEYEYTWGPGDLLLKNEFQKSIEDAVPSDTPGFTRTHSGFLSLISDVCAGKKAANDDKVLWIGGQRYELKGNDWYHVPGAEVALGTQNSIQKQYLESQGSQKLVLIGGTFYKEYKDPSTFGSSGCKKVNNARLGLTGTADALIYECGAEYYNEQGVSYNLQSTNPNTNVKTFIPNPNTALKDSGGRPLNPTQIREELIRQETQKKYLTESTSGLGTSLRAVCIPGVISHLQSIRTIANNVKQCFQTLLISDKFDAGYCKAILTEHVCDLLFDVIRCSFKMFESSKPRSRPGSLGFFDSLSKAGGEINRDVQERYGNTLTFDAMFNNRKLVHQLCLGAFNSDWDWNLEAMLDENRQRIAPGKSYVYLYPAEVKWYTHNPVSGRGTFRYHIGVGVVAGADITYSVNLICSNDESCANKPGYAGSKCDCAYLGNQKVRPLRGPIKLSAGESNWGSADSDIYELIREDAVRYDKVEVVYTYRDQKNELITKREVRDLVLDGPAPPDGCRFDIIGGEYRCIFGSTQNGYARFVDTIKPTQTYFFEGDPIKLQGMIYKYGSENDPNIPMTLKATLRDEQGNIVIPSKAVLEWELTTPDRYKIEEISKDTGGVPGYIVTAEDFRRVSSRAVGEVISTLGQTSYYTDYSKIVTGLIGDNDVVIRRTGDQFTVAGTGAIEPRQGTFVEGQNLRITVNQGIIILDDPKNKMGANEQITIRSAAQSATLTYTVELTLHEGGRGTVSVPIDSSGPIQVQLRNSQSSSICRGGGTVEQRTACICGNSGTLNCGGKDNPNRYCYALTGTNPQAQPTCNAYPSCASGQVYLNAPCDCNLNGQLELTDTTISLTQDNTAVYSSTKVNRLTALYEHNPGEGYQVYKDESEPNNLKYYYVVRGTPQNTAYIFNNLVNNELAILEIEAVLKPQSLPLAYYGKTKCEGTGKSYCNAGECSDTATGIAPGPATPSTTNAAGQTVYNAPTNFVDLNSAENKLKYPWLICAPDLINEGRCKVHPDLIEGFNIISSDRLLDDNDYIYITSAWRSAEQQRDMFINLIKNGGNDVCGPHDIKNKIWQTVNGGNKPTGDAATTQNVNNYLNSHPEDLAALNALDHYRTNCRHVDGHAIDISLWKYSNNIYRPQLYSTLRAKMCAADWINYGPEPWHYEYKSDMWNEKRPDQISISKIGNTANTDWNSKCYWGTLSLNPLEPTKRPPASLIPRSSTTAPASTGGTGGAVTPTPSPVTPVVTPTVTPTPAATPSPQPTPTPVPAATKLATVPPTVPAATSQPQTTVQTSPDPIAELYVYDDSFGFDNSIWMKTQSGKEFKLGEYGGYSGTYNEQEDPQATAHYQNQPKAYKDSYTKTLARVKGFTLPNIAFTNKRIDLRSLIVPAEYTLPIPTAGDDPIISIYAVQELNGYGDSSIYLETKRMLDEGKGERIKIGEYGSITKAYQEDNTQLTLAQNYFGGIGQAALKAFTDTMTLVRGSNIQGKDFPSSSVAHRIPVIGSMISEKRIPLNHLIHGYDTRLNAAITEAKRLGAVKPSQNAAAKELIDNLLKLGVISSDEYYDVTGGSDGITGYLSVWNLEDDMLYLANNILQPKLNALLKI